MMESRIRFSAALLLAVPLLDDGVQGAGRFGFGVSWTVRIVGRLVGQVELFRTESIDCEVIEEGRISFRKNEDISRCHWMC